jgi:hypothetical protein
VIPILAAAVKWALENPITCTAVVGCAVFGGIAFYNGAQLKDERAEVRVLTAQLQAQAAIAEAQGQVADAATKSAQAAAEAAGEVRRTKDAETTRWERVAADRYRDLRLCWGTGAGAGEVPGAGDDPGGAAAADRGAVPGAMGTPVGKRLAADYADGQRLQDALTECYRVIDAQPRP